MRVYLFLIIFFIPSIVFTQSAKLSGVIVEDSNLEKMPWVNVLLIKAENREVISGKMSDENGYFIFNNLDINNYIVEISFMGFEKKEISVKISNKDDVIVLSDIKLKQNATALDDIVLVAEKPTLTQEGGKSVLNVSQALAESPTMEDLMENIPSVQVNEDGGVSIRGQAPVFLIDGVESTADEFNNLSPSIISSIEVQTNASAKYSGAKVINAVLNSKSYQKRMFRGALYYGSYDFLKARFNSYYRKNKWNFAVGAYAQNKNTYREQSLIREFDNQEKLLFQEKRDTINQQKARVYANISYSMNKRNRFSFKSSYAKNIDTPLNFLSNTYENSNSSDNLRFNNNDNTRHTFNIYGLWQHEFVDHSKIEFSAKYLSQPSLRINNAITDYPTSSIIEKRDRYIFDESRNYLLVKTDYEKSFSENVSFESGLEVRITNNNMDSEVLRYNHTSGEWEKNLFRSYNYKYLEDKSTAYASVLYTLDKWQFNIGARGEYIHWVSEVPDSTSSKYIFVPSPIVGIVYDIRAEF